MTMTDEWAEYLAANEKARWAYDLVRARENWFAPNHCRPTQFRRVKNRWGQ
jgi:hypothetical protein